MDSVLVAYARTGWRGYHRLLDLTGKTTVRVRTKHGVLFDLKPLSHIESTVIKTGYYEEEVLEALLPHLKVGTVLWDIGANFGLHAITAKHLKPDIQVVCFEPSPVMFAQLHHNCELNQQKMKLLSIALSDSSGYAELHTMNGNQGMNSLGAWEGFAWSGSFTCYCDTADGIGASGLVPAPNVIKIDVEGWEDRVFAGMTSILKSPSLKAIVFEYFGDSDLKMLTDYGFRITRLPSGENSIAVR
jgi:FkbM family methyltransferase